MKGKNNAMKGKNGEKQCRMEKNNAMKGRNKSKMKKKIKSSR